jgi:sugar-specific transcriptional regulator TrmB
LDKIYFFFMNQQLFSHLQHFGLSDKETKVYVAALELGPSPVQVIARKAGVNRATTYVQIASLNGRGLMSSYDKGKKRYFVAESPERLMAIYEDEMQHLKDKENILKEILPDLKRMRPVDGVPTVRLFEGHDGLETVRQELLKSQEKTFCDFLGVDDYIRSVPSASRLRQVRRVKEAGIKGKAIMAMTEPGELVPADRPTHLDRRVVSSKELDIPGELTVFDNKIVMLSYKGDPVAVLIESKELSTIIRSLFELAWKAVKDNRPV